MFHPLFFSNTDLAWVVSLPKRAISQPRVPPSIAAHVDITPEGRKVAFTFATHKERAHQPRKVAQSFKEYVRPVLSNMSNAARSGADEMQAIRTQIEGAKRMVASMQSRLTSLEERMAAKRNLRK